MMPRDSQVSRVQQAEQKIRTGQAQYQANNLQIKAMRLVASSWYRDEATKAGKTVSDVRVITGTYHRCQPIMNGRTIMVNMGQGRSTLIDLTHTMAHVITPYDGTVALHGPEFCKNMLEVAKHLGTQRTRDQIRDVFNEEKVKWRIWSPEAKEAAKKRAAEHGTPFAPKVSREEQQEDLVAMMRELAGLPPEPETTDPIDAMLKAAKKHTK